MNEVAAILLAAGRSRRMGAFKPLLPFGGRTVIEACIENLRAAGVEETIVVLGHRASELRALLRPLPFVRFAVNDESESEMGVSIARGVEQLPQQTDAFLLALVDQPAIPPPAICEVLDEWRRTKARLVVPEFEGRGGHPVLVSLEFHDELLRLDARKGLRGLFDTHREEVRRVSVKSPYVARDMDTWDDYCALHVEVFGKPPAGGEMLDG